MYTVRFLERSRGVGNPESAGRRRYVVGRLPFVDILRVSTLPGIDPVAPVPRPAARHMLPHGRWDMSFLDRAKQLAEQHDDKIDQALEKIGDEVDKRTDGKYSDQIDKAVDFAQERTGDGDQAS